jgi:hypothetical protein
MELPATNEMPVLSLTKGRVELKPPLGVEALILKKKGPGSF